MLLYDLETKIFYNHYNNINITIDVGPYACLTGNEYNLFIVGGLNLKTLQILNLSTHKWTTNPYPPLMIEARRGLSCIYHSFTNELFAIAGFNDDVYYLNSIEKIKIDKTDIYEWNYFNYNLSKPAIGTRAVIYDKYIIVIGGFNQNDIYIDDIEILDIMNGIIFNGGSLSYPIQYTSPIIVNNMIYAFGGFAGFGEVISWQYGQMLSNFIVQK